MPIRKTFFCLANSRMEGGSCVAGREWDGQNFGNWIRVAGPSNGALIGKHEYCQNGRRPRVYEFIEVDLHRHQPEGHHTENWIIYPNSSMRFVGIYDEESFYLSLDETVDKLVDNKGKLWRDFDKSENNDKIPTEVSNYYDHSLRFIHLPTLTLSVEEHFKFPFVRRRAIFSYHGSDYNLAVTDRDVEEEFESIGKYELRNCYVTVSLGTNHKGFCYKLVALLDQL